MRCHDCHGEADFPLIVDMMRLSFCGRCHRERVHPGWAEPFSDDYARVDVSFYPLTEPEKKLVAILKANAHREFEIDAALLRWSIRALWVQKIKRREDNASAK